MPDQLPDARLLLDSLDEPALLVRGNRLTLANPAARALLGPLIEGNDIRLSIRHPQALEAIMAGDATELELVGIGPIDRPWQFCVRPLDAQTRMVRLIDRSAARAAERMR